jgi:hypothetical protein
LVLLSANLAFGLIKLENQFYFGKDSCQIEAAKMVKLPNAYNAVIEIEKLRDYCLNPNHPTGKHKARGFALYLGLQQEDAEWLRTQILKGVVKANAQPQSEDEFGKRYGVELRLSNGSLEVFVRTAWIIKHEEEFPRLLTCFVKTP